MLAKLYPELTYRDYTLNAAELLVCAALTMAAGVPTALLMPSCGVWLISLGLQMAVAIFLANMAHDLYRHLWRNSDRTKSIRTTIHGHRWALAVLESTLIRIFSEYGRIVGLVERGEIAFIGMRFDWFAGTAGAGPLQEERKNNGERFLISVGIFSLLFKGF